MPTGRVAWFDQGSGEGAVTTSHREYPVAAGDMEPAARVVGARVHFDVARDGSIARAVGVRIRTGTRSSRRQRRFGDLTGAGRPEEKGRASLTRRHPERDAMIPGKPVDVVGRWIAGANSGRLGTVLPLYAPQAVLWIGAAEHRGRNAVRQALMASELLTRGWDRRVRGEGDTLVAWIGPTDSGGRQARFRIRNGRIVEQWVDPSRSES